MFSSAPPLPYYRASPRPSTHRRGRPHFPAAKLIEDGRIDKFVEDRYSSWNTGIGKDIIDGKATMADLEKYALEKGEVTDSLGSGRQEMLEAIVNNIMFSL